MDETEMRRILSDVADGKMTVDEASLLLRMEPFEDLGFAKVDHHRGIRQGVPEVIFGAGKTPEQITAIIRSMKSNGDGTIIVTRLSEDAYAKIPLDLDMKYNPVSRIGLIGRNAECSGGTIAVVTAGTSDIPVAEEAAVTAEILGNKVVRIFDAGVSGIHRLMAHKAEIMSARVVVAVAGMEGALASVVGGMVDCPVIAVPTSVGYGASFGGLSALLTMLNSCASGVSVVNIDNGFGAGYLASMINHMAHE